MTEAVTWKNRARQIQIREIISYAEKTLSQELENSGGELTAFNHLMVVSPIFLPRLINVDYAGNKEEFYHQAAAGAKIFYRMNETMENLIKLGEATESYTEMLLDENINQVPIEIDRAFNGYPDLLKEISKEGRENGTICFLNYLEDKIPLIRYRHDLASKRISLTKSIDNGKIGYLSTKIPNTDLKYWYPRGEKRPYLSLVVKPFED